MVKPLRGSTGPYYFCLKSGLLGFGKHYSNSNMSKQLFKHFETNSKRLWTQLHKISALAEGTENSAGGDITLVVLSSSPFLGTQITQL